MGAMGLGLRMESIRGSWGQAGRKDVERSREGGRHALLVNVQSSATVGMGKSLSRTVLVFMRLSSTVDLCQWVGGWSGEDGENVQRERKTVLTMCVLLRGVWMSEKQWSVLSMIERAATRNS